jgi:hypothetical protein
MVHVGAGMSYDYFTIFTTADPEPPGSASWIRALPLP